MADLLDITPTILYLLEQPITTDMDGSCLTGMIRQEQIAGRPPEFVEPGIEQDGKDLDLTPEEEALLHERLRGLGYLE